MCAVCPRAGSHAPASPARTRAFFCSGAESPAPTAQTARKARTGLASRALDLRLPRLPPPPLSCSSPPSRRSSPPSAPRRRLLRPFYADRRRRRLLASLSSLLAAVRTRRRLLRPFCADRRRRRLDGVPRPHAPPGPPLRRRRVPHRLLLRPRVSPSSAAVSEGQFRPFLVKIAPFVL
jgi:hypothetical protein